MKWLSPDFLGKHASHLHPSRVHASTSPTEFTVMAFPSALMPLRLVSVETCSGRKPCSAPRSSTVTKRS
eukprot:10563937-Alexandrium_andersonii.AAC.1